MSFRYRAVGIGVLAVALTAGVITVAEQTSSIATPANLIQNGSFESPSIPSSVVEYDAGSTTMPNWTVGGNSVDLVEDSYWAAEDGDQSLDLSGSAPGSVSQTVATTAGSNYTLTWWMAGNPNCGQPIKTMNVYWDGALVDSPTFNDTGDSATSMGWVQLQLDVQATSSSTAVEFADATADQSQCGATLDNVSLVPAVTAAPVFTEDSPPLSALAGSTYSAIFFAAGVPAYSLTGAPSWLSITPFGAVTGTPPAGTTSFSYSVTASNSDGNAVAGPYTVAVQTAAAVTGTIVDGGIANNPVTGSPVQACVTGTGECQLAESGSGGAYSVNAPVGSSVIVTAYPLPGSGDTATSTAPLAVSASGIHGETISLDGVTPLSSGLEINGSIAPTVYWANPSTATLSGCPDGFAAVTVTGEDTTTGLLSSTVTPLTETPADSGQYTGTIPPLEPVHGPVDIDSSAMCSPQSALDPSLGSAAGGTTVLVTGSGFTGATGVMFGSAPAESFTVLADQVIQAVAPPGSGSVPVTVTTPAVPSGTTVDSYTYVGVGSVSPASGPAAGGTWVTITGSGLTSVTNVHFGSTAAQEIQPLSDTELEALSPPGSGTADITVDTLYGGTTPATSADQFTYGAADQAATSASAGTSTATTMAYTTPDQAGSAARPAAKAVSLLSLSSLAVDVGKYIGQNWGTYSAFANGIKLDLEANTPSPTCQQSANGLRDGITAGLDLLIKAATRAATPTAMIGVVQFLELLGITVTAFSALEVVVVFALGILFEKFAETLVEAALKKTLGDCPPNQTPPPQSGSAGGDGLCVTAACGQRHNTGQVDPSGTVIDTNGNPVGGATVTILRSDNAAGPYAAVAPSSPGITPSANPETTGDDGVFHWDVDTGWYEIQASAPGCDNPADSSQQAVTIGPYPVPPPQVGLTITLACSNQPPPPTPVVSSLSASTGPATGGTTLTVLGSGFTPASAVKFGQTAAQSVTFLSAQALTVTSPPGGGQVDVTVQNGGTSSATSSADQFFYGSPPAVTGLSPTSGPTAGGTTVTITGTGFTGATAVSFGGIPATSFTVVSDTQIQATAPAGQAGTVDVEVVTPAGASAQVAADQYSYLSAPPAIDGQAEAKGKISVTARLSTVGSGDLVLAFVAADGPGFTGERAKVSGGGLTWTLAKRTNTRNGTAEIWTARASGSLSKAAITSSLAFGGYSQALTVIAFKNAPGIGATVSASGRIGASAASLTTTYPNAWVFAVGNDATSPFLSWLGPGRIGVRTGAGQTLVSEATGLDGGTFWVQSRSTLTAKAGTKVTINDTAPTYGTWNLTLIEVT